MDAFQHVNNIVYFRYFETARIAYFHKTQIITTDNLVGPILAKTNCTFITPLRYPDEVLCTATVEDVMRDRFLMTYHVYSLSTEKIAAKGTGLIVSYDYKDQCKVDLPSDWRTQIAILQATST